MEASRCGCPYRCDGVGLTVLAPGDEFAEDRYLPGEDHHVDPVRTTGTKEEPWPYWAELDIHNDGKVEPAQRRKGGWDDQLPAARRLQLQGETYFDRWNELDSGDEREPFMVSIYGATGDTTRKLCQVKELQVGRWALSRPCAFRHCPPAKPFPVNLTPCRQPIVVLPERTSLIESPASTATSTRPLGLRGADQPGRRRGDDAAGYRLCR